MKDSSAFQCDSFVRDPCLIGRNGMETLDNFYFFGSEKAINWLKNKISKIEEKLKENAKHCLK